MHALRKPIETERERLSWQIGELAKLSPAANEWETLNAEHGTLANAQSLLDTAYQTIEALEGDDHGITIQPIGQSAANATKSRAACAGF